MEAAAVVCQAFAIGVIGASGATMVLLGPVTAPLIGREEMSMDEARNPVRAPTPRS
jgi:hypothetical protein